MTVEQAIGKRDGAKYLWDSNGNTADIMKAILKADTLCAAYTKNLAPMLRGRSYEETCYNVWKFWKENVRYVEDPDGVQFIKSPREVFHTGFCDCKSFSIAVASTLKNLGIKYKYRFVTENPNNDYHHVYVVANTPDGDFIIDCVMDRFNFENPYAAGRDVAPTAKMGAIINITPSSIDKTWVQTCKDYADNIEAITAQLRQRLKNGMDYAYPHNKFKRDIAKKFLDAQFAQFLTFAYCMAYVFWDKYSTDIAAPFPDNDPILSPKKQYGINLFIELKRMGFREADLRDLFVLSCYHMHGVPGDYMIYRAKCMSLYGQPWKPRAGVPWFDRKTATLHVASGGGVDSVEASIQAQGLLVCFPYTPSGQLGTCTKPWGQPYWAIGGWLMENGFTGDINQWIKNNPWPAEWGATLPTVTPAIQKYIQTYNQWLDGNLPSNPLPPSKLNKMNGIAGSRKNKVGYTGAEIVGIVVAVVTVAVTIATFVAKMVEAFKTGKPTNAQVPVIPSDFKEDYMAADGCYVGHSTSTGQIIKVCPDGSSTVLSTADLQLPQNQPPYDPFTTAGNSKLFLFGGLGLIAAALFLTGSKND